MQVTGMAPSQSDERIYFSKPHSTFLDIYRLVTSFLGQFPKGGWFQGVVPGILGEGVQRILF